jgi:hypothetical protein
MNKSDFGLILFVGNTIPDAEAAIYPVTAEGRKIIFASLKQKLLDLLKEMDEKEIKVPILLLVMPGLESVITKFEKSSLAKRFSDELLEIIQLPYLRDVSAMGLIEVIQIDTAQMAITEWAKQNQFQSVVVKPFTNHGPAFDLEVLSRLEEDQLPASGEPLLACDEDKLRAVAFETVPFDGKIGPITGFIKISSGAYPTIWPSAVWQENNYTPQKKDWRVTGTFYFNVSVLEYCINAMAQEGNHHLEDWLLDSLMKLATANWQEQQNNFEAAIQELVMILKFRQLGFELSRGERGYQIS